MVRWTASCAAALLAACGGGTSSNATVNGSVGNISLGTVAEAVSVTHSGTSCQDSSKQEAGLYILLSNTGGHCAAGQSGAAQPAGNVLELYIASVGSGAQAAIGPGTYGVTLVSSPFALGIVGAITSAGCQSASYLSGSGTVTITSISSKGASGSYDLSFVDSNDAPAGTLSGSFTTTDCPIDAARVCDATRTADC